MNTLAHQYGFLKVGAQFFQLDILKREATKNAKKTTRSFATFLSWR